MNESMTAEPPAGVEPGLLARMVGVLFSPGKTFESIARKPAWALPIVILLLWTALAGFLVTRKMDADALFDKRVAQAESKGKTMPPEQAEVGRKITRTMVKIGFLFGVVIFGIMLFLVPLIYHGLCHMLGKTGKYTALLSSYAHVQVVQIVKGILFLAVALPKATIDPDSIPFYLKSNLCALLLDPDTAGPGMRTLLGAIDIFDLWALVLMVIALQKVRGASRGLAIGVVVGVWVVYVLCSAGLATVGGAFGG